MLPLSVYSDTRVIFITIIAIYITLAEKIGTPLITSLTSLASVWLTPTGTPP
jgi:hypothetical protein